MIKITIRNINLMNELKNFLEERDFYWEGQLNSKLFQCPPEMFLDMCWILSGQQEQEIKESVDVIENRIRKELSNSELSEEDKNEEITLLERARELGKEETSDFLKSLLGLALKSGSIKILDVVLSLKIPDLEKPIEFLKQLLESMN